MGEAQLKELKVLVIDVDKDHRDEELVRKYYMNLIHSFVLSTLDEIASYEMEKSMLHHMAKIRRGEVPDPKSKPTQERRPLKPIVITRDAVQKEVFGMGYKNLPVMSIEEFYEERAQNGWYSKPNPSLQNYTIAAADEGPPTEDDEAAVKDSKEDNDDPEELERQRNFDEYKDEHQRGEGNRHNRG